MRYSNMRVEQIDKCNDIINDYSEILTNYEMNELVMKYFPGTFVSNGNVYGRYDKTNYCLYLKNISYLGNPHPIFKKRIQIPSSFKDIYDSNLNRNVKTLLIGVYKYKDCILFCDFETSNYVSNNLNNSSAHIYTIDLKNGNELGFFQKVDFKGNSIAVFSPEGISDFCKYKFEHTEIECKFEIVNTFDNFFESISKNWFGIDCYKEMIDSNYNNKFQSEWVGFYLEFLLDQYIADHHLYDVVKYIQNKKDGEVDLDLYFSKIDSYGDLKTHSNSSSNLLGNDKDTIDNLLENGRVYYIVCNHDTKMDKDNEFEVTRFWNSIQNKDDLLSYSNKMKSEVILKSYYILEINKFNYRYVDIYNQGKNSDGSSRKPKISISQKNIDNFLIHAVEFSNKD